MPTANNEKEKASVSVASDDRSTCADTHERPQHTARDIQMTGRMERAKTTVAMICSLNCDGETRNWIQCMYNSQGEK